MVKARKKVAPKRCPSRSAEVMNRVESFLSMIAPDVVKQLTSAEVRAKHAEQQLAVIRDRMIAHLTPGQIEIAKACKMPPEFYAMELFDLYKEGRMPSLNEPPRRCDGSLYPGYDQGIASSQ